MHIPPTFPPTCRTRNASDVRLHSCLAGQIQTSTTKKRIHLPHPDPPTVQQQRRNHISSLLSPRKDPQTTNVYPADCVSQWKPSPWHRMLGQPSASTPWTIHPFVHQKLSRLPCPALLTTRRGTPLPTHGPVLHLRRSQYVHQHPDWRRPL